jgi:putative FmdB family regulatory protein
MRCIQATKLQRNHCIFTDLFKMMRRFRTTAPSDEKRPMPIYEYRCDNCGHELESIQKLSEAPLKTCPACANDTLRKRVSAAGFRLKGGGWYETDFKSGNKKNVSGDKGAAKNGSDGGSSDASSGSKNGSGSSKDSSSGSEGSSPKSGGDGASGATKTKTTE